VKRIVLEDNHRILQPCIANYIQDLGRRDDWVQSLECSCLATVLFRMGFYYIQIHYLQLTLLNSSRSTLEHWNSHMYTTLKYCALKLSVPLAC
jgi:hypothetical protein